MAFTNLKSARKKSYSHSHRKKITVPIKLIRRPEENYSDYDSRFLDKNVFVFDACGGNVCPAVHNIYDLFAYISFYIK